MLQWMVTMSKLYYMRHRVGHVEEASTEQLAFKAIHSINNNEMWPKKLVDDDGNTIWQDPANYSTYDYFEQLCSLSGITLEQGESL